MIYLLFAILSAALTIIWLTRWINGKTLLLLHRKYSFVNRLWFFFLYISKAMKTIQDFLDVSPAFAIAYNIAKKAHEKDIRNGGRSFVS